MKELKQAVTFFQGQRKKALEQKRDPSTIKYLDIAIKAINAQLKEDNTEAIKEQFNTFWQSYPKKTDKPAALKAFKKLKADATLLNKILSAIDMQKHSAEWQKDNGQFIPYPATWLNGHRWEEFTTDNPEKDLILDSIKNFPTLRT